MTIITIEIDDNMDTNACIEGIDNPTTEQTTALLDFAVLAFQHRETITGRIKAPRSFRLTPTGYDAVRA